MSKNKVVSIEPFLPGHPEARTIVAKDQTLIGGVRHQRFILKMFEQRIAFDFISRTTRLPPETVCKPISVKSAINSSKRKQQKRGPGLDRRT